MAYVQQTRNGPQFIWFGPYNSTQNVQPKSAIKIKWNVVYTLRDSCLAFQKETPKYLTGFDFKRCIFEMKYMNRICTHVQNWMHELTSISLILHWKIYNTDVVADEHLPGDSNLEQFPHLHRTENCIWNTDSAEIGHTGFSYAVVVSISTAHR